MLKKTTVKAKELKIENLRSLSEKIAKAKSLVFCDYRGLTAVQITSLRNKVKEAGGQLIVAKNTLIARALQSTIYQLPTTNYQLSGPTAILFANQDEIAPLKIIADFIKLQNLPKFKFGFFGKDFLDAQSVEAFSKIPPRDVLRAKFVGSLVSPIYGIVSVLGANIRNLVYVLDQAAKRAP
ncbi:50S ribosomal protein L10 [Candidatus Curtissbacteria bacterium RIFCSPHIGHO2_01_FULL_41_44]|uniref:Large ribosomal subunit protein uL10 n=1 Tax=Candidatus Curtissbacteria bacterium RIFCSPLOWO2_01_FULL_42_50 TaxID=1797730 RepID=A0A1F5H5W4_9BACT|nr:MAG: 50S ribosomal protein L10 [Candidatus Curtissbacteria bacterium RIFCSPHIGHO2_01_FULL_41_44]OGD93795.1 MAG: 50S ribosomal protein L10 [Candidatus Curtissbacteria bacterium RIFCSPHIGHO2_02_FULL_42_58]OGD96821.1 MAG: 50S ribosomal protein L10 [Candidatus Curtissbacteria bacterium RIFCSPHIGHO2_12_FULL_42_33]OGD99445.1 MAG: 50S ribosomal protein L10 [Candidatus Curtissbacteria bacterium RIFCSPLOWO2_01_FULL_42_50]OGE03706.1 MAG: 50S ribosomal protein L10 [Candidatus Curtissbacteria bacterium 